MNPIKRIIIEALAYGGANAAWSILTRARTRPLILAYHRVVTGGEALADPTQGYVTTRQFDDQIRRARRGRTALTVGAWLERGAPAGPYLMITFDDGYADNLTNAFPILERYGVPATVFVTTDAVAGKRALWWDRLAAALSASIGKTFTAAGREFALAGPGDVGAALAHLTSTWKRDPARDDKIAVVLTALGVAESFPPGLYLGWEQVRRLRAAGWEIGAHTRSHAILTTLTAAEVEAEASETRDVIAAAVGVPPRVFAYPNGRPGDFDGAAQAAIKAAGYIGAVTMVGGMVGPDADFFALPRVGPKSWEPASAFRLQISNLYFRLPGSRIRASKTGL